jgi:hypothetical protein
MLGIENKDTAYLGQFTCLYEGLGIIGRLKMEQQVTAMVIVVQVAWICAERERERERERWRELNVW